MTTHDTHARAKQLPGEGANDRRVTRKGPLASRLAGISYANSPGAGALHEQLTHELSECMLSLLWFSRQPSEHEREQDEAASTHLPQWFSGAWPAPTLAAAPRRACMQEGFFLVMRRHGRPLTNE